MSDGKPERPEASSEGRRRAMQLQRTKHTGPELLLRQELHRRGLRFRLHRRVLPDRRRSVDIVFPRYRVAVDVRGCFWHGCPEHSRRGTSNAAWWDEKLATNVRRDAETEAQLIALGYAVVVVWEHETPSDAADRVQAVLAHRGWVRPGAAA